MSSENNVYHQKKKAENLIFIDCSFRTTSLNPRLLDHREQVEWHLWYYSAGAMNHHSSTRWMNSAVLQWSLKWYFLEIWERFWWLAAESGLSRVRDGKIVEHLGFDRREKTKKHWRSEWPWVFEETETLDRFDRRKTSWIYWRPVNMFRRWAGWPSLDLKWETVLMDLFRTSSLWLAFLR